MPTHTASEQRKNKAKETKQKVVTVLRRKKRSLLKR